MSHSKVDGKSVCELISEERLEAINERARKGGAEKPSAESKPSAAEFTRVSVANHAY